MFFGKKFIGKTSKVPPFSLYDPTLFIIFLKCQLSLLSYAFLYIIQHRRLVKIAIAFL